MSDLNKWPEVPAAPFDQQTLSDQELKGVVGGVGSGDMGLLVGTLTGFFNSDHVGTAITVELPPTTHQPLV